MPSKADADELVVVVRVERDEGAMNKRLMRDRVDDDDAPIVIDLKRDEVAEKVPAVVAVGVKRSMVVDAMQLKADVHTCRRLSPYCCQVIIYWSQPVMFFQALNPCS